MTWEWVVLILGVLWALVAISYIDMKRGGNRRGT